MLFNDVTYRFIDKTNCFKNMSTVEINRQRKKILSIQIQMFLRIWIGLFIYQQQYFTLATFSFNQPRFRTNATWNSIATTFPTQSLVGIQPHGIFVNSNNSIYIPNRQTGQIHIWLNENHLSPTKTIEGSLSNPLSLFVTTNGDIYVDNGYNGRIDKWIRENERWISVMNVSSQCYGLFIDIYENLYCSMYYNHRVDKKWSNGTTTIVAGTGVQGSQSDMLNTPWGIFVDINLDLYVADFGNNRIQLFQLNQRNGITVAGKGSPNVTIELNQPTGIVLDGDQHLFIVDNNNHRIIGSDENGFRCIFGCSGGVQQTINYPILVLCHSIVMEIFMSSITVIIE